MIEVTVCAKSGKLPTKYCNEGTIKELFLMGTEPRDFCDLHKFEYERNETLKSNIKDSILLGDPPPADPLVPDLGDFLFEEEESTDRGRDAGKPLLD